MKAALIIQARMTSSRMPGKVLAKVQGRPLLYYLLERLKRCARADDIIIATTDNTDDDPVAALCADLDIACFRGSEADVLGRFVGALSLTSADVIVRLTGDSPLIDPEIIDASLAAYDAADADYLWCGTQPTLPNGYICEVFRRDMLIDAAAKTDDQYDREHVTPYLRKPEAGWTIADYRPEPDYSRYRLCVDYAQDFQLVSKILEALVPRGLGFQLPDVVALLADNPDWVQINAGLEQTTGPFAGKT